MATTLLMKTRRLNRLLQKAAGQAVNFMEMAEVLKDTIGANVYVISRKGKILGAAITNPLEQSQLQNWVNEAGRIPEECNEKLKQIGKRHPATMKTVLFSPSFPNCLRSSGKNV